MKILKRVMFLLAISFLIFAGLGILLSFIISTSSAPKNIDKEALVLYERECGSGLTLSVIEQEDEQFKGGTVLVIPLIPIPIGEKEIVKNKYIVLRSSAKEIVWSWSLSKSTNAFYLNRNIKDFYLLSNNIAKEVENSVAIEYGGAPEFMQKIAKCIKENKQSLEDIFERKFHSIVTFVDDEEVVFLREEEGGKRTEIMLESFDSLSIKAHVSSEDQYGDYHPARVSVDENGIYLFDKPFSPIILKETEEGRKVVLDVGKNLQSFVNKNGIDFLTYYTNLKKRITN